MRPILSLLSSHLDCVGRDVAQGDVAGSLDYGSKDVLSLASRGDGQACPYRAVAVAVDSPCQRMCRWRMRGLRPSRQRCPVFFPKLWAVVLGPQTDTPTMAAPHIPRHSPVPCALAVEMWGLSSRHRTLTDRSCPPPD